jgi:spermidine/putrescine transport system ATP-binding protein
MNAGRFEQQGSPQSLYYEPQTPFVAGFVGDSNRVSGRAQRVDGDRVELLTAQGLHLHARRVAELGVGDPCEAFVRPEVARLARDRAALPADQPQHQATVEGLLFDGANSAVLLRESRSRLEFRVALPQTGEFKDLRVGEAVVFAFDPRRALCFRAASDGR